jgi:hypothetical protein
MARDKLITIRIEREKRDAFNQLAKSQNTDTASLLYDFISGCLDGTIDIKLVTGKKQWIDKIDNQLDTNRLDKLEATTQRIDNRLDTIAKRLDDWIDTMEMTTQEIDNRIDDMEPLLKLQREASIASHSPDEPAIEDSEKKIMESVGEPDYRDTLPGGDTSPTGEPVEQNLTNKKIASILGIDNSNLSKWLKTKIIPEKYRDKCQFNHDKTKIVLI